jgi:hypothetical protein
VILIFPRPHLDLGRNEERERKFFEILRALLVDSLNPIAFLKCRENPPKPTCSRFPFPSLNQGKATVLPIIYYSTLASLFLILVKNSFLFSSLFPLALI